MLKGYPSESVIVIELVITSEKRVGLIVKVVEVIETNAKVGV